MLFSSGSVYLFSMFFFQTCRLRRSTIESLIPVRNENPTDSLALCSSRLPVCVKTQETPVQSFIQMLKAPKPPWEWIIDRGQITKSNYCCKTCLWAFKWGICPTDAWSLWIKALIFISTWKTEKRMNKGIHYNDGRERKRENTSKWTNWLILTPATCLSEAWWRVWPGQNER